MRNVRFSKAIRITKRVVAWKTRNLADRLKLRSGFDRMMRSVSYKTVNIGVLSNREMEVLRELPSGLSNKAIARKLDVTERTIKFHLQNIYRKLSVSSRIQALNVAQRYRLI